MAAPAASGLAWLSIEELAQLLRARRVSAEEVARACIARVERLEPRLHAFITVTADRAIADARAVDAARTTGVDGPLAGVPIVL